jgi:hypothetical protein
MRQPRKDTMRRKNRGQFNPERARRAAQARWARESESGDRERDSKFAAHEPHGNGGLDENNPVDPIQVLREIAADRGVKAYARTNAAKALAALEGSSERQGQPWQESPQVREDFVSPTWDEVLKVAREAGAIE